MDYEKLCCERLLQWQQGAKPGPLHLLVFPTFRCNLNCTICNRHWYRDDRIRGEEMTEERLLDLIDESAALGARMWTIGGGGEPMVRPDTVAAMCRRIRHHGMGGSLQTNGTMLSPEFIDELVRLDWEQVTVSIDGCTPESNDRLRFAGAFEKATDAVRLFSAAKKRHGRHRPLVRVGCVLSRFNIEQLDRMVQLVHELGGNALVFIEMILYAEGMNDLAPTPEQFLRLRRDFERARLIGEGLGLNVSLAATPPGETPPMAVRKKGGNPWWQAMCVEPWLDIVVLSSGQCAPCCVFGNGITESLRDRPLEQVWHGPDMERMRSRIMNGNVPPECAQCQAQYISRRARILNLIDPAENFSLNPWRLARKTFSSLRRNGFQASLARGKQWLQLRRRYSGKRSG